LLEPTDPTGAVAHRPTSNLELVIRKIKEYKGKQTVQEETFLSSPKMLLDGFATPPP
jgi:hypothetical protein